MRILILVRMWPDSSGPVHADSTLSFRLKEMLPFILNAVFSHTVIDTQTVAVTLGKVIAHHAALLITPQQTDIAVPLNLFGIDGIIRTLADGIMSQPPG